MNEQGKYEKMKDIYELKMKTRMKLWDWVARVKDTSCKATFKIKDLKNKNKKY